MNDRFRFRFWNKNRKAMETFEHCPEAIGNLLASSWFDNYEIMQSTGLKDSAGNLIYEGDIVKVNTGGSDTSGYGVVEYMQSGCTFSIRGFLDNPSGFYPRQMGEFFRLLEEWLRIKIIGNIYENSELLNVNKTEVEA